MSRSPFSAARNSAVAGAECRTRGPTNQGLGPVLNSAPAKI